ncbi:MAG: hypothetical protein ACOC5B_02870 [Myxococcota bacterium]
MLTLAGVVGCSDDAPDGPRFDASVDVHVPPMDGGMDAATADGSMDAATADGGPDAAMDAGETDAAPEIVEPATAFAITQQIEPVDATDPLLIEVTSVANYPYMFELDTVTPPDGILIEGAFETTSIGCEDPDSTCKQRYDILVRPGDECNPSGEYDVSFNVLCAPDADCRTLDPSYTMETIDLTIETSEDPFDCLGEGLQPQLEQFFMEHDNPTECGDTAVVKYGTSVAYPFTLTAVGVSMIPSGFLLDSFETEGNCEPTAVGESCAQDHFITMTDDGACHLDGEYHLDMEYSCHPEATEEECDMVDQSWLGVTVTHGGNLHFDEPTYCDSSTCDP